MKGFLAACLAAIVRAAISAIVLNAVQEPVDWAFTTPYTRDLAQPHWRWGVLTPSRLRMI